MFKLNDDKTKMIGFTSISTNTIVGANVQVGGTSVEVSSRIINLGITFNQTLSMQTHVNAIACFYY